MVISWKCLLNIQCLHWNIGCQLGIFLKGGPQKFCPSVLFYDTPTINVLLHFKREFSEIWGLYCSMAANFSRKNLPKNRYIFGIFPKKSMLNALKWSQKEIFWRILIKSSIKLPTGRLSKSLTIFENLTPKTPQNSLLLHF